MIATIVSKAGVEKNKGLKAVQDCIQNYEENPTFNLEQLEALSDKLKE